MCDLLFANILFQVIDGFDLERGEAMSIRDEQHRNVLYTRLNHQVAPWKSTFWGLMVATGGDPGGLCDTMSAVNVCCAISMHSSRVLRNVVHVDFTMHPVSTPACRNDMSYYTY